jgi:hypothetical protein
MNKMKRALLTILFLSCITLGTTYAQLRDGSQDRPARSTSSLADQLWFGGGFNLGFTGSNGVNLFQFGLSPMMGYKIFEPFSVGPRVAVQYNHYRARTFNGSVDSANPFSWAVGAFMRYKIIQSIFVHTEFELENQPLVTVEVDRLSVARSERNNVYIGGGYTSGQGTGTFGYEIVLLFNLNQAENTVDLPYTIRFGFTYGF